MTTYYPAVSGHTDTGLAQNVAGALSYLLGPLTGVLFLVLEKENRFVRFHAAQSIAIGLMMVVLSIALSIVAGAVAFVPVIGWIAAFLLSIVIGFGSLILWLALMWHAFQGAMWELPVAGAFARKLATPRSLHS